MMKRQQGFSLVEVLVAVVVLGVIVAAFSGVFSSSIDSILSAGDRYRALMEAQGLLERVLATGDLEGLEGVVEWEQSNQPGYESTVGGRLITVTVPAGPHGVVRLSAFQLNSSGE
jgi:prepilin-type N-terminal cleavage/methylation domain-containing protein